MYYVIRDSEKLPPSIIHEDNYFAWYNPMKKDHRIEFRGTMNQCYTFMNRDQKKLTL
jgi:hypothetical protein